MLKSRGIRPIFRCITDYDLITILQRHGHTPFVNFVAFTVSMTLNLA